MIYRIQTLYLLITLIISFSTAIFNCFQQLNIKIFHIFWIQNYLLKYFFYFSSILSLLSLFFFKKRTFQLKINYFNIIINIVFILLFFYFLFKNSTIIFNYKYFNYKHIIHYIMYIFISFILIIFLIISNKFIQKDEFIIKSLNRIR